MATLTQIALVCDVCGNPKDVQTQTFGLDGKAYEIDLCPKDSKGMSKVAAGYVSHARKATARQNPRRGGRKPRSGAETAAIGNGARAPGTKNSGRGRATGSPQEAAKTSWSKRQAATTAGATAAGAGAKEKTKAGRAGQKAPGPHRARPAPKRAAKATSVPRKKGIYVYGILPADIEVAGDTPGVGEFPGLLRVVHCDGLAALISEVDLSSPLGASDDRRVHRDILDATAAEVPVLPLAFGTVLTNEDAVAKELLTAHHDEFADALDQLEGRAEFLVRGRYVGKAVTARRQEDAQALREAMQGHCAASVAREPADELDAVHVAFLVTADDENEVERVIEDLAREWAGRIDVQLLGPMAAYDFVGTAGPAG